MEVNIMKNPKKFLSAFSFCLMILLVLSACQTNSPTTDVDTTADTQATSTAEAVEDTTPATDITEEITEASTTPPEELKSVIYVGLSSENIADLNIGSSYLFDFQPVQNLFPEAPTLQSEKENIKDLQVQVKNKTVKVPYQMTFTKEVELEIARRYGSFDAYYSSNNSVRYEYYPDGKLKNFHKQELYRGESKTLVSPKDAIAIAKTFLSV